MKAPSGKNTIGLIVRVPDVANEWQGEVSVVSLLETATPLDSHTATQPATQEHDIESHEEFCLAYLMQVRARLVALIPAVRRASQGVETVLARRKSHSPDNLEKLKDLRDPGNLFAEGPRARAMSKPARCMLSFPAFRLRSPRIPWRILGILENLFC